MWILCGSAWNVWGTVKYSGSTAYEGLKTAIQGFYDYSGIFPPLQTPAAVPLTLCKVVDVRGSTCSACNYFIETSFCPSEDFRKYDGSWTVSSEARTLEGTKVCDKVLKVFRYNSSLCDVFRVSFCISDKAVRVDWHLAKIGTQLQTEVKVEEIIKVIPLKHE